MGPSGGATVIRDIGLVSANVQGDGFDQCVGTLVGQMFLTVTVENAYATGQLSAGQGSTIGGLVGCNISGTIRHSYSAVAVTDRAEARAVGGLVGANFNCDTICNDGVTESYATGAVVGGDAAWVGGLVADNEGGTVTNSYATGSVAGGTGARVGGLLGICSAGFTNSAVTDSYSTGAVIGGTDAFAGGSVGYDFGSCGYTDISWDLDTSGISDPAHGAGNIANDPGITGLTDAQLKSGLPSGFDPAIWGQNPTINNGYPYLLANPPPQ